MAPSPHLAGAPTAPPGGVSPTLGGSRARCRTGLPGLGWLWLASAGFGLALAFGSLLPGFRDFGSLLGRGFGSASVGFALIWLSCCRILLGFGSIWRSFPLTS